MSNDRSLRVLLAEDYGLVRAGIRALLEALPCVESVTEASDGHTALQLLLATAPDVALLDIGMPGLNGIDVAERARREAPATRVVMLSAHDSPTHITRALRAGAVGYMLKHGAVDELPVLMRAVMNGQTYLSPGIASHVVDGYLLNASLPPNVTEDPLAALTSRQREILQLVAEGRSTKEVAQLLGLSVKTVETHRAELMARLDIHEVAGLVRFAIRTGLVTADR